MSTNQRGSERSGWMVFAMTLFIVLGAMDIIYGIAMLANSDFVVFTSSGAWLVDITAWGWITLIVGVLQVVVGWGLMTGSEFARVVGIVMALIAALNAFFVIPIYAVWGILTFAVSLMVIYALSAGRHATTAGS
jgi:hypothetical protein